MNEPPKACDERIADCIEKLRVCQSHGDEEQAHQAADEALCELLTGLGMPEVVAEWRKVKKWYS